MRGTANNRRGWRLGSAVGLAVVVATTGRAVGQAVPDSVYDEPLPDAPGADVDGRALSLEGSAGYSTDYVFRGIERFEVPTREDAANFQFAGRAALDGGKLPGPFVSVFANLGESDEVSNLQEVRPTAGVDWDLRLFRVSAGNTFYQFPNRSELDTKEVFASIEFDDAEIFGLEKPVLTPFVFAAYDYDLYDGLYAEAGVRHTTEVGDLSLTFEALVAYADDYALLGTDGGPDSGFPFYQLGLLGRYELNDALNLSRRYGRFSLDGYLYYTDGIDNDLRADTQMWGGAAIGFRY